MAWVSVPGDIGRYGYKLLALNTTVTGSFWCIQTLGRTVFQSLVDTHASTWVNVSLADGTFIYGHFTYAELSSQGCAIMYYCGEQ